MIFLNFIATAVCAYCFFNILQINTLKAAGERYIVRNEEDQHNFDAVHLKLKWGKFIGLLICSGFFVLNTIVIVKALGFILLPAVVLIAGTAWAIAYRKGW